MGWPVGRHGLHPARHPYAPRAEEGNQARAPAQRGVGGAPPKLGDEPGGERSRRDIAEIEAHEDEREGEAAALLEPARDGGRAEQIEARRSDSTEESHEEVELPECIHQRHEGEGRSREYHGEDEHDARPVPVREGPDAEAGQPAHEKIDGERDGDRAAAPAEGLGEHGKEDAVGGERYGHPAGDEEQRGHDEPGAGGRTQRGLPQVPAAHRGRAPTRSRG